MSEMVERACPDCNGEGYIKKSVGELNPLTGDSWGAVSSERCQRCNGWGALEEPED